MASSDDEARLGVVRWLPPVAAIVFFVALVAFGAVVHWVEEAGTAERDGYVAQAELLLRGELPRDPFRPLLYPLLVALATPIAGSAFTAARLLSNVAALAVLLLAYGFAVRLAGPRAGLWALVLTAVNANVWILGQHVTTDMLFAALGGAAWWFGLLYFDGSRRVVVEWWLIAAAATLLGLAALTRGSALFLVPGFLAAWWGAPPRGERRHRWQLLAAGLLLVLLRTPHWLARWQAFGDPWRDDNWKNLAWKLYGFPDWSYLERVPFAGAWDLLRHDPFAILSGGAAELARFVASGGAQLIGTWMHVVLLVVAVGVLARTGARRRLWLLAGSSLAFLAMTAFSFFTWGRLLLVVLPVANAVLAAGVLELADLIASRWRERRAPFACLGLSVRWVTVVLFAAVALLAVKTFAFRLPAFVARHPYGEVAALRRLDRELGEIGGALAGTSPYLGRYLEHPYVAVPDAFGNQVGNPELYLNRLRARLQESDVRFLVISRLDLRDRPLALLDDASPAPWLVAESCDEPLCVWRLVPGAPSPAE